MWRPRDGDDSVSQSNGDTASEAAVSGELRSPSSSDHQVLNKPPEHLTMPKPAETKAKSDGEIQPESPKPETKADASPAKPKKPKHMKRVTSAGLRTESVLHGDLDFSSDPWPSISESAKDLVRKMLVRDPKKRLTAH
ncbi:hypothetical protein HID58_089821, partial [Brassica napus]